MGKPAVIRQKMGGIIRARTRENCPQGGKKSSGILPDKLGRLQK
jgi:hypothetical protein